MLSTHRFVPARRWPLGAGVAAVLVVALALASCGDEGDGGTAGGADRPTVVATTGIWADVVGNVACDGRVEVRVLIPEGADPHGFEPSLADRASLEDAALVVSNGLLLEEGLVDALADAESDGTPVFAVGDHVDTIDYLSTDADHADTDHDDTDHSDDADHDHADHDDTDHADHSDHDDADHDDADHGGDTHGIDPHIWFDPTRVAGALPALGLALVEEAGLDPAAVDACVATYQAELDQLDRDIGRRVAAIPVSDRLLLTNHDALGYFADRYGFEVVATVSPTPSGLAEANPARLETLVDLIEDRGIRAVFAEAQSATDEAEALATRVDGVEVVELQTGALGPPGSGADSYIGLVASTAEAIAAALGG
jgi:ABC-type Zn uptake system ZnuABC Zn-binding protein ZnuA